MISSPLAATDARPATATQAIVNSAAASILASVAPQSSSGIALASPPGAEEMLADPGLGTQLCFDYINNGSCTRMRTGLGCRYRHLHRGHPDVIADRIRQGKLNPTAAAAWIAQGVNGGAGAAHFHAGLASAPQPPTVPMMPTMAAAAAAADVVSSSGGASIAALQAAAAALPDPGPGAQLCFDFVNR